MTALRQDSLLQALLRRANRVRRQVERYVRRPRGFLVYHRDYRGPDNLFSDPLRGQKIIDYLLWQGCVARQHLKRPRRVTIGQLALVHTYDYLQRLDDPTVLERIFGEDHRHLDVDRLIAQQRRMVAGTLAGARTAVRQQLRGRPVINVGGGMHHAHADHGEGFCIFNDVAVAISVLRADGFSGRILILDLDLHHGNGNQALFAQDPTVFTVSVHATDWEDIEATADLNVPLGAAVGDEAYRDALRTYLPRAFEMARPELVFYLAGVDVAADDKIGNWRVSPEGVLDRDQLVFRWIGNRPSVWCLAGGYGPDAWRYTARTLAWMLGGFDAAIETESERELRHFRRIARQFTELELCAEPDGDDLGDLIDLTPEDLFGGLAGRQPQRYLGFYSAHGIETALEHYGVLEYLRGIGIRAVRVEIDPTHETGQLVQAFSDDERCDLLIEVIARRALNDENRPVLYLEWLLLQNPRRQPTPERPLLPGQEHPGLGCLEAIVLMLLMACERLGLDALLFAPSHFHVAEQARGLLHFVDPAVEGRFLALEEALAGRPMAEASWLVHREQVIEVATGAPYQWEAAQMMLPLAETLKARFESPDYQAVVEEVATAAQFRVPDASAPKE